MKIIDILFNSANLLGLTDDAFVLESMTEENETQVLTDNENIKSLYNLVQFSVRELCTNYVPMIEDVTITTTNKSYPLSSLENYIRVQNVFENKEMVKFKIINRNLIFDHDGKYVVKYATYPTIISMFEEIGYLQNLSPDAIVFGLCAYYSLAHGMFEEFQEFYDKYISKAESLKSLRNFDLPCRRWEWEKRRLWA